MEGAAIWRIHRRIGVVLAQSRRILVQVDHVLWKGPRRELAEEELVQARHVHRCLVDGLGEIEDKINCWRLAEELEGTSLIEDQEVCVLYKAEGSVVRDACRAEGNGIFGAGCAVTEEMVRQHRSVFVEADDVCR